MGRLPTLFGESGSAHEGLCHVFLCLNVFLYIVPPDIHWKENCCAAQHWHNQELKTWESGCCHPSQVGRKCASDCNSNENSWWSCWNSWSRDSMVRAQWGYKEGDMVTHLSTVKANTTIHIDNVLLYNFELDLKGQTLRKTTWEELKTINEELREGEWSYALKQSMILKLIWHCVCSFYRKVLDYLSIVCTNMYYASCVSQCWVKITHV